MTIATPYTLWRITLVGPPIMATDGFVGRYRSNSRTLGLGRLEEAMARASRTVRSVGPSLRRCAFTHERPQQRVHHTARRAGAVRIGAIARRVRRAGRWRARRQRAGRRPQQRVDHAAQPASAV